MWNFNASMIAEAAYLNADKARATDGKKVLAAQRSIWESYVAAINRVARPDHA